MKTTVPTPEKGEAPVLRYYDMGRGVTAFSTTRQGGTGTGAYGGTNVNRWCGDDPDTVERNKRLLLDVLEKKHHGRQADRRLSLIMPHQTHGTRIARITRSLLALDERQRDEALDGTDAVMTDVEGVCIGVSTADCIPLLLYDAARHATCAVHAGWRGTVERIAEKAVAAMADAFGTDPRQLKALIGPGISVEAFEVGDEVYEAFRRAGFDMEPISRRTNKWHIDLWECNRLQLTAMGVKPENIAVDGTCTYGNADTFFSARRLGISSGRILTGIIAGNSLT